ncbi:MAG: acyltransferase [Acidobacteriaceae bacterium]
MAPRVRPRLPALDGIRGLAIVLVLWHHCYMQPRSGFLGFIYQLNHAAWVGVDLFFVLSGFLISGILYDSLGRENYFKRFYRRRVLRIFPLYYGAIFLLLALSIPLSLHWHGRQWLLLGYLQNIGIIPPFHFDISNWVTLNHFWSLSIEEQYYLAWPLVVYLVRDRVHLIWTTIALSLLALALRIYAAPHINAAYLFTATPFRMDALLMGSCLALLYRAPAAIPPALPLRVQTFLELSLRAKRSNPAAFASNGAESSAFRMLRNAATRHAPLLLFWLTLAAIFAVAIRGNGFEWWNKTVETAGFTLTALCGAALIALCLREGITQRLFQNQVLRFFGKYSYGLYVWHAFVYAGLRSHLTIHFGALLADLGCVVISVAIALVSYYGFEKWFLRLKDKPPKPQPLAREELVCAN